LDVNKSNRTIKYNFPDKELWELEETCALDVADKGSHTLEKVGKYYGVTREAVRQIEKILLGKIKSSFKEYEDWEKKKNKGDNRENVKYFL